MGAMILFIVTTGNYHVLVYSPDRDAAKRDAERWLGYLSGSDDYTVTPLTAPGDRIHIDLSLSVWEPPPNRVEQVEA